MDGKTSQRGRLTARPLKGRCSLLRHHHIANDTHRPWTARRFLRLAKLLNCTPEELCEYAAVFDYSRMAQWLKADSIPPYVALHFVALERAYGAVMFERPPDDPMPVEKLL